MQIEFFWVQYIGMYFVSTMYKQCTGIWIWMQIKMEIHMLQLLVDQAERELEAALQKERDAEMQLRLLRKETLAQRAVVRDLENALRKAQQVRNIILIKGTWQRGGFSGVFAEIGSA